MCKIILFLAARVKASEWMNFVYLVLHKLWSEEKMKRCSFHVKPYKSKLKRFPLKAQTLNMQNIFEYID